MNKCLFIDMRLDLKLEKYNGTISSSQVASNARGERFSIPEHLVIKKSVVKRLADRKI